MIIKMRNPTRIPHTLDLIQCIWESCPYLRFNQLIHNLQYEFCQQQGNDAWFREYYEKDHWITGLFNKEPDLFHLEDGEFCKFLENYLDKLQGVK
jgi:hypothetical protein